MAGQEGILQGQDTGNRQSRRFVTSMSRRFVNVAVPIPTDKTYSYEIPVDLEKSLSIGSSVLISFRGRRLVGWVTEFADAEIENAKPVIEVVDPTPMFTPAMLKESGWFAAVARFNFWLTSGSQAELGTCLA